MSRNQHTVTNPIPQPGDRVTTYATDPKRGQIPRTGYVARVGRHRQTNQTYLKLDDDRPSFPLTNRTPGPEYDEPLSEADVDAISQVIQECLQSGDVRDLTGWKAADGWHEPLQASLTAGQKRQVLAKLTSGARDALRAILTAKGATIHIQEDAA